MELIKEMNKNTEQKKKNLITKESLRPANTRSKTPCSVQATNKESSTGQAAEQPDVPDTLSIPIVKTRCRRQWEQWSWEEKKCFFDGLAEYGKDYSKIQTYMNKKLKLKNYKDGKTKEQIRFFYHRTWSKISKSLKLQHEDDTKKSCRRELHYLLCLGELRKKRSYGFGAKVMKQLQELATKGVTYVRQNGRNLRVRPPNRFLRKIYRDITDSPEIILPKTINLEFLPNSNVSFNFVQKHAFNPRIRFTGVNINSKFSEVFDMLNKRFTDLYTNENLTLYIYPIQSDLNTNDFANVLANAEDLLIHFEKNQDTNIVVEKDHEEEGREDDEGELSEDEQLKENKGSEDLHKVLPNILAMYGQPKEKTANTDESEKCAEKTIKSFPGYWNYEDAQHVYMTTLFVALEQKPTLKFKYEWNTTTEKKTLSSFPTSSLQYLVQLCESQKQVAMQNETELKSPKVLYEQKPVVPGILSTHQNGFLSPNNCIVPLRPRPGRKRTVTQRSGGAKSPIISNIPKSSTNKLLENAVAVNLIPQPPQLIQFAHLPPESMKLVNSGSAATKEVTREEVVEGYQEHFQSLNKIIQSSALAKEGGAHGQNIFIQATPKKVNPTSKQVPLSPSLEWLNETVDISLTSFLNVCDMQALQNKPKMEAKDQGVRLASTLHNKAYGHVVDPVLPKFESSEASQGPLYDLSFELSNQNAKSKDQFTMV